MEVDSQFIIEQLLDEVKRLTLENAALRGALTQVADQIPLEEDAAE